MSRRMRKGKSSPLAGFFGLLLIVAVPIAAIRSCITPDPGPNSSTVVSTSVPVIPAMVAPTPPSSSPPSGGTAPGDLPHLDVPDADLPGHGPHLPHIHIDGHHH